MRPYFCGYYFKHQILNKTVSFIPGFTNDEKFIQVITESGSYFFSYNKKNHFSEKGIIIDIGNKNFFIRGAIKYGRLTPVAYNIMGPFRFLPMQCSHGIISMYHKLIGYLNINGRITDFSGGTGYIEMDCGHSFPKSYMWIQCNDFKVKASVMAAVSDIPLFGLSFKGCICVVWYNNTEYRFATYLGAVILVNNENELILKQGELLLQIDIQERGSNGYNLYAPVKGKMRRIIRECCSCKARFRFYNKNIKVFDMQSQNCSYEFVPPSEEEHSC